MSQNLISQPELRELMKGDGGFLLLDVREQSERDISKIDNSFHICLENLADRCEEFGKKLPIVIYCHSGIRSFQACRLLELMGFSDVKSLVGGIEEWTKDN